MKTESRIFFGLTLFFFIMTAIYGLWTNWSEPVGPVGLLLSGLLTAMVSFYTWMTGRKMGLRPDDNPEATIDEFEGDYGFFSPYSWTPLWLGASAAMVFAGLAIGWWLFIIGASFGVVAIILWTFEYFTGEHAL